VKTYDAIGMTEVWIEEKYWKNWEKNYQKISNGNINTP
jgi:hypothetical protein